MTVVEDPGLLAPPARLRQPAFWMGLLSLSFLISGLVLVAIPDSMSGDVVLTFTANHGLREADLIGLALLVAGIGLTWLTGWVWQWRQTR